MIGEECPSLGLRGGDHNQRLGARQGVRRPEREAGETFPIEFQIEHAVGEVSLDVLL